MISLQRSFFVALACALVGLPLASCGDGAMAPSRPVVAADGASRDGKPGDVGNAAKSGSISVRVLLDATGGATVEFRTGTYNESTGLPAMPASTDGYFTKIQYKVNNAAGKQILVRNIKLESNRSYYTERLNLCGSSDDDENDDGKSSSCSTKYDPSFSVTTQANLKGVGNDGHSADVTRDDGAPELYYGDVNLTGQPVYLLSGATRVSLATASVPLGLQTYQVDLPNIPVKQPAAGVQTQCLVFVDGSAIPQIPSTGLYVNPNGFTYVGNSSPFIAAGSTSSCTFTLNLSAAAHKISVTALAVAPGDYNPANNSTAVFSFTPRTVSGPLNIKLGSIQRYIGLTSATIAADTVTIGVNGQFILPVSATGAIPGGTTSVVCTVGVTAPAGSGVVATMTSSAVLTTAAPTGACLFALPFDVAGRYAFTVTAADADPLATIVAPNPVGASFTALEVPPGADMYISAVLQRDAVTHNFIPVLSVPTTPAGALPPNTVHVGVLTDYQATISLQNAHIGAAPVTVVCTVKANGVVVGSPQTIQVSATQGVACPFQYKATGTTDAPLTFTVTLSAQSVTDPITTNDVATAILEAVVRADVAVTMAAEQPVVLGTASTVTINVTNQEPLGGTQSDVSCKLAFPGTTASLISVSAPTPARMVLLPQQSLPCTFSVTVTAGGGTVGAAVLPATASVVTNVAADDRPADNSVASSVVTTTGGKFDVSAATTSAARQDWKTVSATDNTVYTVTNQELKVSQLALLVLPKTATLGYFELTGTIVASGTIDHTNSANILPGNVTFESGFVGGTLASDQCGTIAPGTMLTDAAHPYSTDPSHVSISAVICATASTDPRYIGLQQISVSYTRSLNTNAVVGNSGGPFPDPMWASQVSLYVKLAYRLSTQAPTAPLTVVTATVVFDASTITHGSGPIATKWWNMAASSPGFTVTSP
jgi:hypothetical protein